MEAIRPDWVTWDEASGTYDRAFWGRIPPWERTEWGRYLRLRRGTRKQDAVLADLRSRGETLEHKSQYSEWENRKPLPTYWRGVFGSMYRGGPETLPEVNGLARPSAPATDLSALIESNRAIAAATAAFTEAVDSQTQKLDRVWDRLGDLIERLDRQQPLTKGDAQAMAEGLADGIGASLAGAITDLAAALRRPSPARPGGRE